jgi:hypothetical protein
MKCLLMNKNRKVQFIPLDIATSLPNLNRIVFDHLALTKITTDDFKGLAKLEFLYLDSNFITEIADDAFADLHALSYLDLDYNKLTTLHADIFRHQKHLETISIHDNFLTTLDESIFSRNPQLKSIKLHNNEIDELGVHLLDNLHLTDVNLKRNKCIDVEYSGSSITTSFVMDVGRLCRPGRWKWLEAVKEHSVVIIVVCLLVILAFVAFLVFKKVMKTRRQVMKPMSEIRMNQRYGMRQRTMTVVSSASCEAEHIYDVIDESKVNQPFNDKKWAWNGRNWV